MTLNDLKALNVYYVANGTIEEYAGYMGFSATENSRVWTRDYQGNVDVMRWDVDTRTAIIGYDVRD